MGAGVELDLHLGRRGEGSRRRQRERSLEVFRSGGKFTTSLVSLEPSLSPSSRQLTPISLFFFVLDYPGSPFSFSINIKQTSPPSESTTQLASTPSSLPLAPSVSSHTHVPLPFCHFLCTLLASFSSSSACFTPAFFFARSHVNPSLSPVFSPLA